MNFKLKQINYKICFFSLFDIFKKKESEIKSGNIYLGKRRGNFF